MASPSDHKATIIDGTAIAQTIRSEIADDVRQLSEKYASVLMITLSHMLALKLELRAAFHFNVVVPSFIHGCLELLSRSGITIKGKNAVVVGRSNIVGLPVSLLLKQMLQLPLSIPFCDDQRGSFVELTSLLQQLGKQMMIKGSWIKPGAAVIDVGKMLLMIQVRSRL
ncbi:hypothetical protein GH714_037433 [Hevea brasiliensis]|uniref:Tetrahydrofolate dehydrogenase/cyclohydrolase NAD(P)-binding domain-containing protein n=1 Tax=Hevea brasiliensis TaxID=3981 RepID=A0A6A6MS22_HEVBR|nr:hypothetical protein GH714_037433 [Hevea brasiliensis]